jgi:hypothetical protein
MKLSKIIETILYENINLLNEIGRNDAYNKFYKNISQDIFDKIVNADPFSSQNNLGPYAKWLLKLYVDSSLKLEDLYKATEYIKLFDRVKHKLSLDKRNLLTYKSLSDLFLAVKDFKSNTQQKTEIKQNEAKKVYEDNTWLIVVPLTHKAACYYGSNTEWCTASKDSDSDFNTYTSNNEELFILIHKTQNRKYQFHFESNQFMDENDREINLETFLNNNKELRGFFNNYLKDKIKNFNFSDLVIKDDGSAYIVIDNWKDFENAFPDYRNYTNPAIYLNELFDDDLIYEEYYGDFIDVYNMINKKNLLTIIRFLFKNGVSKDKIKEDLVEVIKDSELYDTIISCALSAQEEADKAYAYIHILNSIKRFFNIHNVEYANNKIFLHLKFLPDPIDLAILIGKDKGFIDGYAEMNNYIDYDYPYHGFSGLGDVKKEYFNEILTDNLYELV